MMRTSILGAAFGAVALPHLAAAVGLDHAMFVKRVVPDPVSIYLTSMCYPMLSNGTFRSEHPQGSLFASLASSSFPCEQASYISASCMANGTTPIDFDAEQQCFCKGQYFALEKACSRCYIAHGYQGFTVEESEQAAYSISIRGCLPTPAYQPFTNLWPSINATSNFDSPPMTLGLDRFPNNTEVSNYYVATETDKPLLGEITGSATARLTTWTNLDGERFTPTSTPTYTTETLTGPTTHAETSTSSGTASTTTTATGNFAARGEVGVTGLLVGVGIGAIAYL